MSPVSAADPDVWWPGHEGQLHDDLEREHVERPGLVADAISSICHAAPGTVDVLAIGPLSNLAEALDRDPALDRAIRRVYMMGGDFRAGAEPEHNILCDVAAARRVFDSDLEIVIGGLDLTTTFRFTDKQVDAIRGAGQLGAALGAEIEQWWELNHATWSNPHDPIVALSMLEPDLFTFAQERALVTADGRTLLGVGRTVSRIVTMNKVAVGDSMVARIRNAGMGSSRR